MSLNACKQNSTDQIVEHAEDVQGAPVELNAETLIRPGNAFGIEIGMPVAMLDSNRFTKGVLQTGEGDFDVYWVEGDNHDNSLGYVLPMDFVDQGELVHMMVVLSPKHKTVEFMGVGHTLAELRQAYPTLSVHGSEIEGYVFASAPNYDFKLDMHDMRSDIPLEELDPEVKVTEVWLK